MCEVNIEQWQHRGITARMSDLSDKSSVGTHDKTVANIRQVDWNELKQWLLWIARKVA